MTVENLYRAIGNMDDKYLKDLIKSETDIYNTAHSQDSSPYEERTIEVSVVRKTKRRISVIVAAALLIGSVAAAAVFMGTKKDKKEYTEKKIENYFREDERFSLPEGDVILPEQICSDDKGVYFNAFMSLKGDVNPFVSLYSISENKLKVIELDEFGDGSFAAVSVSDKNIWIEYTDPNSINELVQIDVNTLQISGRVQLSPNEWVYDVGENEDGTYLVRTSIAGDHGINDCFYCTYDNKLNIISRKSVIDSELMDKEDVVYAGNAKSPDGSYYTLYYDSNNVYTLYKYSSENELLYRIEDVTADLEGGCSGFFISARENPVIFSYSSKDKLYYFDELDAENGEVINRYEMALESDITERDNISANIARGGSTGKFDFSYISDKKLYGCAADNEKSELITDLSGVLEDSANISSLAVSENNVLLAGDCGEPGDSGMYICQADYNGNIVQKNKIDNISSVSKITIDENGDVWMLSADNNAKWTAANLDKELKVKKTVKLDIGNSEQFIADSSGRIAAADSYNEMVLYDSDGNRLCSNEISQEAYFFESDGKYYAVSAGGETCESVIYLLDFDKSKISEVCSLEYSIKSALKGNGRFDAFFSFNEGLYGYSMKDNSLKEVINWMDSDMDFTQVNTSVTDENTIVCRYLSAGENYSPNLTVLRRVDDATLMKIQERKVLNVAAGFLSENISTVINNFNKTSENYRIHIEDFSKYSESGLSNYLDSGLSALESEFINGNVPDMVLFGNDFDIMRYIGFDAFADIGGLLDNSEGEYFENILGTHKTGDKQYAVPLTYQLICMTGKSENAEEKTLFTADNLSEMNKEMNIFYGETFENLVELLISSNINEYIDTENFSCNFETESFIKTLELIKDNGVTLEEHNSMIYNEDENISSYWSALADGLCRFQPSTINNFSSLTDNEQYLHMENNAIYVGLPAEKSTGIIIDPQLSAAVFDSSENKEAAAEFLRYLLSEEIQYQSCVLYDFVINLPVNKSACMKLYEYDKDRSLSETSIFTDCYGKRITQKKSPDENTLETVNKLISSATVTSLSDSVVREIIVEQTSAYFSDEQSAEETVKNIQNKVSVYLKEIK